MCMHVCMYMYDHWFDWVLIASVVWPRFFKLGILHGFNSRSQHKHEAVIKPTSNEVHARSEQQPEAGDANAPSAEQELVNQRCYLSAPWFSS